MYQLSKSRTLKTSFEISVIVKIDKMTSRHCGFAKRNLKIEANGSKSKVKLDVKQVAKNAEVQSEGEKRGLNLKWSWQNMLHKEFWSEVKQGSTRNFRVKQVSLLQAIHPTTYSPPNMCTQLDGPSHLCLCTTSTLCVMFCVVYETLYVPILYILCTPVNNRQKAPLNKTRLWRRKSVWREVLLHWKVRSFHFTEQIS